MQVDAVAARLADVIAAGDVTADDDALAAERAPAVQHAPVVDDHHLSTDKRNK